jgi:hypothetical protein
MNLKHYYCFKHTIKKKRNLEKMHNLQHGSKQI